MAKYMLKHKNNMAEQDNTIRDAQYRKGLSIAFFNATNAAVEMVKLEKSLNPIISPIKIVKNPKAKTKTKGKKEAEYMITPQSTEDRIIHWRDWLLSEHKTYYETVIANVGVNYRSEDSIAKLKEAKNLEELNKAWRNLSQDERHDGDIIKVAQELRNTYRTNESI